MACNCNKTSVPSIPCNTCSSSVTPTVNSCGQTVVVTPVCASETILDIPCVPCTPVVVAQTNHCVPASTACQSGKFYVQPKQGFNVPACNQATQILVDNADCLREGAYLVIEGQFQLKITKISVTTGHVNDIVTAKNDCTYDSGTSVGDWVNADTKIGVSDVPFGGSSAQSSSLFPYLLADFRIPKADECVVITVNNPNGISPGDTVLIKGLSFTVSTAVDSITGDSIRICNTDGTAQPINGLVTADVTCDGIPSVPLTVSGISSPCAKTSVTGGTVIVCASGVETTLTDPTAPSILTFNTETEKAEWQDFNLDILEKCTALTACFTLDSTQVLQEFIVTVADSTVFTDPELAPFSPLQLVINDSAYPLYNTYELVSVVDSTHIKVKPTFTYTGIVTIGGDCDGGIRVCVADCCTLLKTSLTEIEEDITAINTSITTINTEITDLNADLQSLYGEGLADSGAVVVANGAAINTSVTITPFTFTNPSTTKNCDLLLVYSYDIQMTVQGGGLTASGDRIVNHRLQLTLASVADPLISKNNTYDVNVTGIDDTGVAPFSFGFTAHKGYSLLPGASVLVELTSSVVGPAGAALSAFNFDLKTGISILSVSVKD